MEDEPFSQWDIYGPLVLIFVVAMGVAAGVIWLIASLASAYLGVAP